MLRCTANLLPALTRSHPLIFSRKYTTINIGTDNTPPNPPASLQRQDERTSEENAIRIPPIPDLPPPVQGWPSFWVIRREVEQYLYPLYDRGWGVKFLPRKNYTGPNDRYIANLTTEYTFANFRCASQFIADLASRAETEKHHPTRFSLQNAKRPILSINVLTDTALRPRWNEEDPDANPPLPRRVPGITRRDLRFAVLLEQLYDTYYADGRALEPRGTRLHHIYDRPTWEYFVSRLVRSSLSMKPMTSKEETEQNPQLQDEAPQPVFTGDRPRLTNSQLSEGAKSRRGLKDQGPLKCMACGGPHKIQECAVRSQHPPPTLCYFCLEPHWWIDCPARQNS